MRKLHRVLSKLYYTSFDSIHRIYERAKEHFPDLQIADVKDFVEKQAVYQVAHKPKRKKHMSIPIVSHTENSFQGDLMFLTQYKKHNSGYHIILVLVDVSSRYLFAYPLKDKGLTSVKRAFEQWFEDVKEISGLPPRKLVSDQEASFNSKEMKKWFQLKGINYNSYPSGQHRVRLCDNIIRTIRTKVMKYFISYETLRWIDEDGSRNVIQGVARRYNNKPHIKFLGEYSPKEIYTNPELQNDFRQMTIRERKYILKQISDNLKPGDLVRIQLPKKLFRKTTGVNFSSQTYTVIEVRNTNVTIMDQTGEEQKIHKKYLMKVHPNIERKVDTVEEMFARNEKQNKIRRNLNELYY